MVRVFASTALAILIGCSKPVVFRGDQTLSVSAAAPVEAPVAVDPPRVELRDNKIVIREKVQFEYDRAVILPASFGLLDQVAQVIKANPHIKKLQVEGHASAEGDAKHNQVLSDQRARSVMQYLTGKGIASQLLLAKGYGIDNPIADNATSEGREQNRRVEFNILEQDVTQRRVEIDKAGTEKIIEEKRVTSSGSSASSR